MAIGVNDFGRVPAEERQIYVVELCTFFGDSYWIKLSISLLDGWNSGSASDAFAFGHYVVHAARLEG